MARVDAIGTGAMHSMQQGAKVAQVAIFPQQKRHSSLSGMKNAWALSCPGVF
jgi:hypothetical protein